MILSSARKNGKKFLNPVPTDLGSLRNLVPILKEFINNKAENTPAAPLGPFTTDTGIYNKPPESGLRVTWLGHSSLLIEIDGKRILTDPVWSDRASFLTFIGPKRFFKPPMALHDLPSLDAIIISHDHFDHLDAATIHALTGNILPFYCPIGVGQFLNDCGIEKNFIHEMDWGDSIMLGNDCQITATPARHFSGRGLLGRNETLWASFVIRGPKHNIFFGADSGWFPGFARIGEQFGPFDLTMLEIGAYGKHWPDIHMGPDHASNAHLALQGKVMMPIHWGTFNLAPHAWYEPIERLQQYAKQKDITLFAPEPGKPVEVKAHNSEWWKKYM